MVKMPNLERSLVVFLAVNSDIHPLSRGIISIEIVQLPLRQEDLDTCDRTTQARNEKHRSGQKYEYRRQRQNDGAEAHQEQARDERARCKGFRGLRKRVCIEAKAHK